MTEEALRTQDMELSWWGNRLWSPVPLPYPVCWNTGKFRSNYRMTMNVLQVEPVWIRFVSL